MTLIQADSSIIFLTGFMASGKTTTGIFLANALGLKFFDLDAEIEKQVKKSIAQILKEDGGIFFRHIEHEILKRLNQELFSVVALGGGTIAEQRNLELIKQHGIVVCLVTNMGELWDRISESDKRQLLIGEGFLDDDQLIHQIEFLLDQRRPYYQQADIFVDTANKSVEQVVKEIIVQLELKWHGVQ